MKRIVFWVLLLLMIFQMVACKTSINTSNRGEEGLQLNFQAQYVRTDGYQESAHFPQVAVLRSTDDWQSYYNLRKDIYSFGEPVMQKPSFLTACQKYDQDFFQNNLVIFIVLEEASGSNRHKVKEVSLEKNGELVVNIQSIVPEWGDDDMAQWHIMIELKKETNIRDVTVVLNDEVIDDLLFCP